MYVHLALHHPKNPEQRSKMMDMMPAWAEFQSKQKGFIHTIVGEVQDENIIFLTGLWESEMDFKSAFPALAGFLSKIDFPSLQDGPTRSGTSNRSDSPLTAIKVGPVSGRPSSTG
jgi:hypothetical protein